MRGAAALEQRLSRVAVGGALVLLAAVGLGTAGALHLHAVADLDRLLLVAAQAGTRAAAEQGHGRAVALAELLAARSQARSGVDVDREVAAMVELQNAYTVNARVVATVHAMWDALFGAVR